MQQMHFDRANSWNQEGCGQAVEQVRSHFGFPPDVTPVVWQVIEDSPCQPGTGFCRTHTCHGLWTWRKCATLGKSQHRSQEAVKEQ